MAESDELTLEQELPLEAKEAKEEFDEPQNPEEMDNLNVTVDNLEELALTQAGKAYFDQEQDQELLTKYVLPMNRMEQLEPDFRSLEESEKLLFSSIAEQENEKENTKNSFN
ncbi:hypothetical protein E2L09_04990 [Enterococcus hirae]|uniref:hypothetical protein n=1 Tax=Enterococcus hirae TaxID=1354 RepID=UPI0013634610|nr:hypothetical protein [Enterococcus hirae]EMF0168058.1 hypothetical protein [Enterococcus hirae]EMF0423934.1 hypothetical protein [Enterococcus hirae]NBJ43118.1 hypothetical protein [Enterococcus hirae]QIV89742.1 hypothetical protein E2L09_04990 [Enterococcus hirae]